MKESGGVILIYLLVIVILKLFFTMEVKPDALLVEMTSYLEVL